MTSQARPESLLRRLLVDQEVERRALTDALHGTVAQDLAALTMVLYALEREGGATSAAAGAFVEKCHALAGRALEAVRSLSHQIHPPHFYAAGLEAGLEWYAEQWGRASGSDLELDLGAERVPLAPERAIVLYRVVEDLLGRPAAPRASVEARIRLRAEVSGVRLQVVLVASPPAAAAIDGALIEQRVASIKGAVTISLKGALTTVDVCVPVSPDDT